MIIGDLVDTILRQIHLTIYFLIDIGYHFRKINGIQPYGYQYSINLIFYMNKLLKILDKLIGSSSKYKL